MKKEPQKKPQEKENKGSRQQYLYDIFVSQAIKLCGPAAEQLKQAQGADPSVAMGDAIFTIVNKVETEGSKFGFKFDYTILANGLNEILQVLLQLSGLQLDETQIKTAIGHAVGRWMENGVQTGKLTEQEMQNLMGEAQRTQAQIEGQQPAAQPPQQQPGGLLERRPQ